MMIEIRDRMPWGREMIDLQIDDAHLGRRPHRVPRLSREAHDPRTGIVNVDLRVARMYSGQGNAIPASKLDEVFDGRNGNLKA